MRSLNEHAGDGKTIKLPEVELTELEDIGTLLNMTPAELQSLKTRQEEIVSKRFAALVASKYQGKPCMGTSIHARAPHFDNPYEVFFFDHTFMEKFQLAQTSSEGKLDMCAGSFLLSISTEIFQRPLHFI